MNPVLGGHFLWGFLSLFHQVGGGETETRERLRTLRRFYPFFIRSVVVRRHAGNPTGGSWRFYPFFIRSVVVSARRFPMIWPLWTCFYPFFIRSVVVSPPSTNSVCAQTTFLSLFHQVGGGELTRPPPTLRRCAVSIPFSSGRWW